MRSLVNEGTGLSPVWKMAHYREYQHKPVHYWNSRTHDIKFRLSKLEHILYVIAEIVKVLQGIFSFCWHRQLRGIWPLVFCRAKSNNIHDLPVIDREG